MDGLEGRKNVYIIAATNRPDIIDRAVLRPGRFDKLIMVRLPDQAERLSILQTLCTKIPVKEGELDLEAIASDPRCDRFSGADLASLIREAGMAALREAIGSLDNDIPATVSSGDQINIRQCHFDDAFGRVCASVTPKDAEDYAAMERRLLGSTRISKKVPQNNILDISS
jgi:ribosome biogenesis ATPase